MVSEPEDEMEERFQIEKQRVSLGRRVGWGGRGGGVSSS